MNFVSLVIENIGYMTTDRVDTMNNIKNTLDKAYKAQKMIIIDFGDDLTTQGKIDKLSDDQIWLTSANKFIPFKLINIAQIQNIEIIDNDE